MLVVRKFLRCCLVSMCICIVGNAIAQDAQPKKKQQNSAAKLKVKIGTEGSYVPFSYFNNKGKLIGFDIDLGNKICERLNYDCEWLVYDWTSLFQALENNSVQLVISSRALSKGLTTKFDKSIGYYKPYYVITYHRDSSPEGTSNIDLASKTIGVLKDTIESDLLKQHYSASRVRIFAQLDFAFYALSRREIDLLAIDYSAVTPWLAGKGDGRCCVYRPFIELNDLNSNAMPIYFNTSASLLQTSFGNFLQTIIEDGTASEIAKNHGLNPNLIEKTTISPYK